jgi:peptide methionine sulfoxide reductase msrA/msrB
MIKIFCTFYAFLRIFDKNFLWLFIVIIIVIFKLKKYSKVYNKHLSIVIALIILSTITVFIITGCSQDKGYSSIKTTNSDSMKYNKLTPEEEKIIIYKGTERPFSGKYDDFYEKGVYVCKRCNAPLFESKDKFNAGCGWPSFDDEISGAIIKTTDADGIRTEITCANCGAHLGHVFLGEHLTNKDARYCVNSISMVFIPESNKENSGKKITMNKTEDNTNKAIFAAGCFWGVQYYFDRASGVLSTEVGYTGGNKDNPTYKEVCYNDTHHAEAIEVTFDTNKTSFENLVKYFFEIHDFTQVDRQGPDVGEQYRSEIFYFNDKQKEIAENTIKILQDKGYNVATKLEQASTFWKAEDYHQEYYQKNGESPYCHVYKKIF